MYEVGSASAYHDAVRMGIGLHGRNRLGKPFDGKAGIDDTYHFAQFVLDGQAVGGHHIVGIGGGIKVHIWFRPTWTIQQFGHKVPIHIEILVVFAATL